MQKRVKKSPLVKPPAGKQPSQKKGTAVSRKKAPSAPAGAGKYEAEREKLGRDVHDRIGQPLTALKFFADSLAKSPVKNAPLIDEMRALISAMQVDVRNICLALQPASDTSDSKPGIPSKQPGGNE